jgi:glycosyltransferase involved in cell wall biosynthesis/peptidoglycan/xylan/chitin deacetylase (PgdA/CDA1 family)
MSDTTRSSLPLRIGLVLDHPSPHMVALLDALAERSDCAAKVVYCGRTAPERDWGSPLGKLPHVFSRPLMLPGHLKFNPTITQTLAQVKADVWVLNTSYTSPTTPLAAWWFARKRVPWIYLNEPPQPRHFVLSALRQPVLSYVLARAWVVVGMGAHAQEIYRNLLKDKKLVCSVPYYAEMGDLLGLPLPKPPADSHGVRFVSSGQMIKRKGFDILLKACELLPRDGWCLTIAGDGHLRSQLEGDFRARWTSDQVSFVGQIPYEDRASVFTGNHVFAFPSRWDGWGMVVPEAMAAGLPVVTTDQVISGREFVENGLNGFIVPANNPALLAEKMAFFLENPEKIPQMGAAARDALESYNPVIGADKLLNLLFDIFEGAESVRKSGKRHLFQFSPTWQELTNSGSSLHRVRTEIRQASKTAVCRAALLLGAHSKPTGNRILVYHVVLPEDRKRFEEHLKFFQDHFVVGSVADVFSSAGSNGNHGPSRMAITFDDGFGILMGDCLEALEKFNMKACFFAPTAFVEAYGDSDATASFCLRAHHYSQPLGPLRPEDLKLLTELGHEIGSHGVSHVGLGAVSKSMADRELSDSRSLISQWTSKEPVSFAYPYGEVRSSLGEPSSWVQQAGYSFGLTLRRGRVTDTSNPFQLPREHAEGNWSLHDLRYFLSSH